MDIQGIVAQLRQEASRIEQAIVALVGLGSQSARRGRPPKVRLANPAGAQKRRRMSTAARASVSVPLPPFAGKVTAHYTQTPIEPPNSVAEAALVTVRCTTATSVTSRSPNRPEM